MPDREWCTFHPLPPTPSGKTKRWRVSGSGGDEDTIGRVQWHGPWRQYIFVVGDGRPTRVLLAASCLRQIEAFCDQQTEKHRAAMRRTS